MSEHDSSQAQAASIKARLKYASIDDFVEGFGQNLSRSGVFIKTSSPRSVGTKVRFCFQISDGTAALDGLGKVAWVRETETAEGPAGMGIRFHKLTPATAKILERIEEVRREGSLPDHSRFSKAPTVSKEIPPVGDIAPSRPRARTSAVAAHPSKGAETPSPSPVSRPGSAVGSPRTVKGKPLSMGNVDDMLAKLAGELPVPSKPPASRSMTFGATTRPPASKSPKLEPKLEPPPEPEPLPEPELPSEPELILEPEPEEDLLPELEELFSEDDGEEKEDTESEPSRSPFEPKLGKGPIESEGSHDPLFNQPTVHYYEHPDSSDSLPKEGFPSDQYEVQSFLEKPPFPHEPPTAPMEPGLIIEEDLELAEEEVEEIQEESSSAFLNLDEEDGLEELDVLEELDNPEGMPEEVVTRNQDLGPLAAADPFDEGVTRTQDLAPMAAATAFDDIEHSDVTERYDAVDGLEIMNQLAADDSLPSVEVLPESTTTTGPFEITESDLLMSEEGDTKSHPVILPDDLSEENPPDTLPDEAVPKGLMSKKNKETGNISLYDSITPAPEGSSVPVPEAPPPEDGAPKKGFLKKLFGG